MGTDFLGETDARLRADGSYELWSTVTAGRRRREFSGRTDPAVVQDVVALMAREELWTVGHVNPHQADDDALAIFEVGDGQRSGRVELWVSEVASVPAFDRCQQAVLGLVRRLSNEVILENGR